MHQNLTFIPRRLIEDFIEDNRDPLNSRKHSESGLRILSALEALLHRTVDLTPAPLFILIIYKKIKYDNGTRLVEQSRGYYLLESDAEDMGKKIQKDDRDRSILWEVEPTTLQ